MSSTQITVWIWPRGLYPGQIPFYLKAKSLPSNVLNGPENPDGTLTVIPIKADPALGLIPALSGTEPQPPGSLLPVMKVNDGSRTQIIHQSTAVVQYLEEFYSPSQGYKDLSGGSSLESRAQVRAIVQLITDAMTWIQCDFWHSQPFSVTLGLIKKEDQSADTSAYGKRRWRKEFEKLDRWITEPVVNQKAISLSGAHDTPTTADFNLLSVVEFFKDMFQVDLLEGFAALEVWYKRYSESEWYVRREDVDTLGESRFKEVFQN